MFGGAASHVAVLGALLVVVLHAEFPVSKALPLGLFLSVVWVFAQRIITARCLPSAVGRSSRAAAGAVLGLAAVSAGAAWFPSVHVRPWMLVPSAGAAFAVALLYDRDPRRRRVLLVGGGEGSRQVLEDLATRQRQLDLVALVGELDACAENDGSLPRYGALSDLPDAIEIHRPDIVVVNVKKGRPEVFQRLLDLAGSGFRVVGLPELYEHAFGRVPVAQISPAWFMSVLHLYQRPYTSLTKRTFDVAIAFAAILVTLPLIAVMALLIRRPVLYRQVRVGEWGRTFMMYKFRTMREGAEETGTAVYAAVNDQRITRVGRILRRTRLDELPQLWNVLIGDMSIVGPRPERPEFSVLLEQIPWWMRRNMAKPGITGWAQINSGYASDTDSAAEKLSYDLWYLRHRSLLLDLIICLRTMPKLVTGSGAH